MASKDALLNLRWAVLVLLLNHFLVVFMCELTSYLIRDGVEHVRRSDEYSLLVMISISQIGEDFPCVETGPTHLDDIKVLVPLCQCRELFLAATH